MVQDGSLYLMILISRATIDSRSTVPYIQKRTLSELDDHLTSVYNNVTLVHDFVALQLNNTNNL